MDESPEVPLWTGTETRPPMVDADQAGPQPGRPGRRRRGLLIVLGVVALVAAAGLGGWLIGQSGDSDGSELTTGADTDDPAGPAAGGADTDSGPADADGSETDPGPDAEPTTTVGATTSASVDEPFTPPPSPDNPDGATQYAVISGGVAYLRGWYPDVESAARIVAEAEIVMGEGYVVDETRIDPRVPTEAGDFPVYIEDYILFESDSAEIAPDFYPILDAGVALMSRNPDVTETVVARTDYRGDAEYNLELSRQRAQAVADYWISKGVDPDQILLDPRGEQDASQDADETEALRDRRVELVISGVLAVETGEG